MIITLDGLKERYADYVDYKGKIRREREAGRLIRLKPGIYEDNPHADPRYLISAIYSPCYLSFEWVLSYYDLIPEHAFAYTMATYRKDRKKSYVNHFGTFLYRDVPPDAYSFGVKIIEENGYAFMMATKEKALCDKLYIMPPVTSIKRIKEMLFDDLRIEEEDFWNLSMDDLLFLAPLYKSNNLNQLAKMIKERKR